MSYISYTYILEYPYSLCVCVFFTLNRSSTRLDRHPAHPVVSVLILHPRKISSVVTSYDTEIIMHRNAFDNALYIQVVDQVDNISLIVVAVGAFIILIPLCT